ncbi:putative addiction module killer protein [Phyllobacterium sp. OV277]|nr:putative addiction module killer protein [Phyllobacterium sp. OV277]
MRLDRLIDSNPGDIKLVGDGVSELRIDYGPGYRVYFIERNDVLIILLCGGDKSTQDRDIRKAKTMAAALRKVRS